MNGFELYSDRFLKDVQVVLAKGTFNKRLDNFFKVAISNMRKGNSSQWCLTTRVMIELIDENEITKSALQNILSDLQNIIEEALVHFQRQGKFSGEPVLCAQPKLAPEASLPLIV